MRCLVALLLILPLIWAAQFKSEIIIDALNEAIADPSKKADVEGMQLKIKLTARSGGEKKRWLLKLTKNPEVKESPELSDKDVDLGVEADDGVLMDIVDGKLDVTQAWMDDQVQVTGDMMKGLGLADMFEKLQDTKAMKKHKRSEL